MDHPYEIVMGSKREPVQVPGPCQLLHYGHHLLPPLPPAWLALAPVLQRSHLLSLGVLDDVVVADGVGHPEEGEGGEPQQVGHQVVLVLL